MKNFPRDYQNVRPGWLPDWSDENAYIDHGDNWQAWAWEFLRRNPEYQVDYARWDALPWYYPDHGGHTPKEAYRTYGDDTEMIYFYCAPEQPAREGETVGEYEKRTSVVPKNLQLYLFEKWGIDELGDPVGTTTSFIRPLDPLRRAPFELECYSAQEICSPTGGAFVSPGIGRDVEARVRLDLGLIGDPTTKAIDTCLDSENYLIFAFDMRDDPKRQAEEVLEILRQRRKDWQRKKKSGGGRARTTLRRLRVFDAVWTLGEGKQAHIGVTIHGHNADSTVSSDLDEARKLVFEGGYRDLLMRT